MQNTFTFKVNAFNERIKQQLHSQPTFHLYNHLHRHLYVNTETIERRKTKLKRNITERKHRRKQRITIYIIDLKKQEGTKKEGKLRRNKTRKLVKLELFLENEKRVLSRINKKESLKLNY